MRFKNFAIQLFSKRKGFVTRGEKVASAVCLSFLPVIREHDDKREAMEHREQEVPEDEDGDEQGDESRPE